MKKVSLIIPCFNEEKCVTLFYKNATQFFQQLNKYDYELIFVNDGSIDNTKEMLHCLAEKDKKVKVVNFSRNFGQQSAMSAGFKIATGDCVAEMDCDGQDPMDALQPMLEKWEEGFHVVHAVREQRKGETWFKKLSAKFFYFFFNKLSKTKIQLDSGEFKLYDRKVVDTMNTIKEKETYYRFITSWVGYKQCSVKFVRNERMAGETKYNTKKLIKLANNTIITNSTVPLYISFKTGIVLSLLSILCMLTFMVLSICKVYLPLVSWVFPFVALLFGIDFVLKGITNAYIDKIYMECKDRPDYIIDTTENL